MSYLLENLCTLTLSYEFRSFAVSWKHELLDYVKLRFMVGKYLKIELFWVERVERAHSNVTSLQIII